ncbi:MAG TPA: methyl-accepting chemotaxis protein [Kofleriaceae bacterium]|nr:methyl-accepting chemotaxis protein [Kofleriaceae bacterium]
MSTTKRPGGKRSRRFRIPMFVKFLIGCLSLAAFLIIGSTYVVKSEVRFRNRGNYLAKFGRRLAGYTERVGRGMTGQAEMLASDTELRLAIKTTGEAGPIGKRMYDQLMTKNGLQPDVFAIFTPQNRMLWSSPNSPVTEADLPELAAAEKARSGSTFAHANQLFAGVPYQISAVPIRAVAGDEIVGALMIGVKLERYYNEWAEQTDEDPVFRTRPLLVEGSTVLAAALPADKRSEVARALQPDKWIHVKVGDDERDIIRYSDGDFDFWGEDLEGYKGGNPGRLGKQFLIRNRANIIDPAQSMPWGELAVAVGASLLIAFLMGFWVTRPINQMVKQSRELLAGETDLTQRIVVSSRDETADLAENINQVFARVHELATGVQSAAFQVGASSAEISAASRQMLSGLKDQTLKVESSTTAVTELSASIQQVAVNAAEATDVAEKSSTAVNSAVKRMDQIRSAVDDAAEKMKELGESSKRIGNIVEVIRQISEQTSMLALNASIEAAHAGEQGRGFAVVADEVSSLARRVGQSAKDIEALIQTVKEQTRAAIASMEVGTREVVGGSELVTSTLTGLGQLITVVKDTATAVHEQAVVSDEIARNMDAVRNLATEALHGSEESVVQSERLHELAYQLEESISGFNLDGTKIGAVAAAPPPRLAKPALREKTNGDPSRALPAGPKRAAKPPANTSVEND